MNKLQPYLFVRDFGFYTVELPDDKTALACVELNPGTIRIENLTNNQVIYEQTNQK